MYPWLDLGNSSTTSALPSLVIPQALRPVPNLSDYPQSGICICKFVPETCYVNAVKRCETGDDAKEYNLKAFLKATTRLLVKGSGKLIYGMVPCHKHQLTDVSVKALRA